MSTCYNYRAVLHPIKEANQMRLVECRWCAHPQARITAKEATTCPGGATLLTCRGDTDRCQLAG